MLKQYIQAMLITFSSINRATASLIYSVILFSGYLNDWEWYHITFLLFSFSVIFISSYINKKYECNLWKRLLLGITNILLIVSGFIFFMNQSIYTDRIYLSNEDNQQIVLQGMVHYANKEFFKDVNTFVKELKDEEFKHLYEAIKVLPEHEEIFNTKTQRFIKNNLNSKLKPQSLYFNMYSDDIRADLNSDELLDGMVDKGIVVNSNEMLYYNNKEKQIDFLDVVLKIGLNVNDLFNGNIQIYVDKLVNTNIHYHVIEKRNKKAVDTILLEIENNNVILTYGNAHIVGITELLEKEGFKIYRKEKVLAIK